LLVVLEIKSSYISGHGLADMVVLGWQLDLILQVFSIFMILWFY